ncbi:MAG TPA: hypothetical protein VF519_10410 [Mycobacteriales bacterium]|jgi:hypothetical protein
MKRTLSLRREELAELTAEQLVGVAGGAITAQGASCPLLYCLFSRQCYTPPNCPSDNTCE